MDLLLDTCTLLWWVNGDELSPDAQHAIADPGNRVWISAVSIWEIAVKQSLGKLELGGDLDAVIEEDFLQLPVTFAHARQVARLPLHHRDPFDRMLIAQARSEEFTLVTRDRQLAQYAVRLLKS
ncbi:MAG: type II toxin-antitoxin system VapC family toxin [bacterium]|nr:type II toxin-antitoxin system VapC family toxin [bacterium]